MRITTIETISLWDRDDETRLYVNGELLYEAAADDYEDLRRLNEAAMSLSKISEVAVQRTVIDRHKNNGKEVFDEYQRQAV